MEATTAPDLEAPTDELLLQVRTIMEAAERGELSSLEVDEKLREVVESVVLGQVTAGREIAEEGGGDATSGVGAVRERIDEEPAEEAGGKRRREQAGR